MDDEVFESGSPELYDFFEEIMDKSRANYHCIDCDKSIDMDMEGGWACWGSANNGCYFCMKCSGLHRSVGVHLSFVRSTVQDKWKPEERRMMEVGGNAPLVDFLKAHGVDQFMPISEKYKTVAAIAYRILLKAKAESLPVPLVDDALEEARVVLAENKWDIMEAAHNAFRRARRREEDAEAAVAAKKAAEAAKRAEAERAIKMAAMEAERVRMKEEEMKKANAAKTAAKNDFSQMMRALSNDSSDEELDSAPSSPSHSMPPTPMSPAQLIKSDRDRRTLRAQDIAAAIDFRGRSDTLDSSASRGRSDTASSRLDRARAETIDRGRSETVDSLDLLCAEAASSPFNSAQFNATLASDSDDD